jgi:hypothetical protein
MEEEPAARASPEADPRKVAAVVRPSRRFLFTACTSIVLLAQSIAVIPLLAQSRAGANPGAARDERSGSLDVILLLDKSLSMAPYFAKAKEYAAGSVIGSILVPGDRLIVEAVYGKVDRLVKMDISSETDKAAAIRAIRDVKANGRFTDLGNALDVAKKDLDELGQPERPKYVLMITDERQEAPAGSPYQATDYKLKHPSLEYVKKIDLGEFRAIIVGLQVKDKVAQTAPEVMKLLLEPPVRNGSATARGAASVVAAEGIKAGSPGSSASARSAMSAIPSWALAGAAGLLVLAVIGIALAAIASRKSKKGSSQA